MYPNWLKLFVNNRNISHEDITRKIIETDEGIYTVLGEKKEEVLSLFDGMNETVNSEIISVILMQIDLIT